MAEVLYLCQTDKRPLPLLQCNIRCPVRLFYCLKRRRGTCSGYEEVTAAPSLACCSAGREAAAAWNSAPCLWANSFISETTVLWVSGREDERQTKTRCGQLIIEDRLVQLNWILKSSAQTAALNPNCSTTHFQTVIDGWDHRWMRFTFINILVANDMTGSSNNGLD